MKYFVLLLLFWTLLVITSGAQGKRDSRNSYPAIWFSPIHDANKPDWEILPQEAKAGEVILSKRNALGILSNFAATPFELYGKRYSVSRVFGK